MASSSRRSLLISTAIFAFFVFLWVSTRATDTDAHAQSDVGLDKLRVVPPSDGSRIPVRRRHNIAVASVFGYHFDVYMALVWTLRKVLSSDEQGVVRVFAEPFSMGFPAIIDRLGLYRGTQMSPNDLVPEVLLSSINTSIDMVILGTCEVE